MIDLNWKNIAESKSNYIYTLENIYAINPQCSLFRNR